MASNTNLGLELEVDGVKSTIAALRNVTPDVKKRLDTTIRAALKWVESGAKSRYPKGAWSIRINQRALFGSIAARSGGERASSWSQSAPGVKAAVFEFAGKFQPGATPQASAMIESLNRRYGSPGRFLWSSWDSNSTAVLDTVREAVYQAERELDARLKAGGLD